MEWCMSVMKEVNPNQPEKIELPELNQRERTIVHMFRQLDQERQGDIIRFIDVLLSSQ
jgi:hypothetical protein